MATSKSLSQPASMLFSSSQLEQWFATIEKNNEPNTTETNSDLALKFLARFGLKDAAQVIKFLKTHGGNETINMIAKEIMKEEAQIQLIREQTQEELLRQQRLLFLLLSLIAKDKAQAKLVSEITQQQIDQRFKEAKSEAKKNKPIAMNLVDATYRAEQIQKFDKELLSLEHELDSIEDELDDIEEEMELIEEIESDIETNMDFINLLYQASLTNTPIINHYISYNNQQIASLTTQISNLRAQQAQQAQQAQHLSAFSPSRVEANNARFERKIQKLEDKLSFYQAQQKQTPKTSQEIMQQKLDRIANQLVLREGMIQRPHQLREIDGLKLQKQQFLQGLKVINKELVPFNGEDAPIFDLRQARLFIDPNHRERYKKYGDSFAVFSEDVDPSHLSERDWSQAKQNYEGLKSEICPINSIYFKEQMKDPLESMTERTQLCQSRAQRVIDRISKVQSQKIELLQDKTPPSMSPFSMTPKPQPKSSYSLMLERLVPSQAPAPRPQDILKAHNELEAVVTPDKKDALSDLINEVKPGEIMAPENRYNWFNRFMKIMPDVPVPEELEPKFKYK